MWGRPTRVTGAPGVVMPPASHPRHAMSIKWTERVDNKSPLLLASSLGPECQREVPARWPATPFRSGVPRVTTWRCGPASQVRALLGVHRSLGLS